MIVDISITVVISGPEADAGSKPMRLIRTGMMLEKNVPAVMENQTDKPITNPNIIGFWFREGLIRMNTIVTTKDITDSTNPDSIPEPNS